jgi:hypothetical protein
MNVIRLPCLSSMFMEGYVYFNLFNNCCVRGKRRGWWTLAGPELRARGGVERCVCRIASRRVFRRVAIATQHTSASPRPCQV